MDVSRLRSTFIAVAVAAAAALPARAINEGLFARDAPITRMTEEDFRIAGEVIRKALDEGQQGRPYAWKNPATGASGSITPGASFKRGGMPCRAAHFTIAAGGKSNASAWNLCRTSDGWKVAEGR
jgi:surface antigen